MSALATVVVPTHDHGPTLRHSVGSALAQTIEDLELLIVGDGVTEEARQVIAELVSADERVRFIDNPKGERHGERHRHAALSQARGRFVFYLSDDDLWFPEHVELLAERLETCDFAHVPPLWLMPDGRLLKWTVDLSVEHYRTLTLSGESRLPLSSAAHTLDAYRRLPHGWRPAPPKTYTDHWMWLQFLEADMEFACSPRPTVLHLPASVRKGMSAAERLAELESVTPVLRDPERRLKLTLHLVEDQIPRYVWLEAHAQGLKRWLADRESVLAESQQRLREARAENATMRNALRWRAAERLLRLPLAGAALRKAAAIVSSRRG